MKLEEEGRISPTGFRKSGPRPPLSLTSGLHNQETMRLGCSLPPSVCGYDTATLGTETGVKARAVQSTHLKVSFAVCALSMLPA